MSHQMHLKKSGSGMSSMTACGRNILRTPMALGWAGFSATPVAQRCAKCHASKHAAVNARMAKAKEVDFGDWEPVDDPEAAQAADDARIAAHRAKRAA